LPVCSTVPAGSAFFASRDTITPFEALDAALISAADPATSAAAADVPLIDV
jgi:hypothetical protein